MSKHLIEVVAIEEIKKHPNADRLDLARTGGWWCAVPIGSLKVNEKMVYIPPFSIITEEWANKWEIAKYCPPCPKSFGKREPGLRVMATTIRNIPSYGCFVPLDNPNWEVGKDVSEYYNIKKYESPIRINDGKSIKDLNNLTKYNDIDNLFYNCDMFSPEDDVIATEKIHGTNVCIGYIKDTNNNNEKIYVCSSHQNRRYIEDNITLHLFNKYQFKLMTVEYNEIDKNKLYKGLLKLVPYVHTRFLKLEHNTFQGIYALPLKNHNIRYALKKISELHLDNDVLFYGEIYGNGIQDMKYGLKTPKFALFDISINGRFLDFDELSSIYNYYNIPHVNVLYEGKSDLELLKKLSTGLTTMCNPEDIKDPFKGKEGIVIKPIKETVCNNSRKIGKLINIDYYNRSNEDATEYH